MPENVFNNLPFHLWNHDKLSRFIRSIAFDVRHRRIKYLASKSAVGLGMIVAIFPLLVIRLIRPLLVIRLADIPSNRISPFILTLEIYLCELDAGLHGPRALDIFYNRRYVANQQVNRMWKRTLTVSPLAEPVDRLNRLLPGGKAHQVPWHPARKNRDTYGLMSGSKAHVSFTEEEERRGQSGLRTLGIPEGAPYICFHSRDATYMATTFASSKADDSSYRNSNIQDYVPAVEALTRLGYYALRMGAVVEGPLETANPSIIDYASSGRTEFLDIYLLANCRFFLGGNAGVFVIAEWFRRPVIHANFVPIQLFFAANPYDLTILKKLWLRSESRYLTFREILGSNLANARSNSAYEESGIDVVNSTPEEITAVALEMEERIKGTWAPAKEDEELQKQFWSLWKPDQGPYRKGPGLDSWAKGAYRARVGAEFLRQNQPLLK